MACHASLQRVAEGLREFRSLVSWLGWSVVVWEPVVRQAPTNRGPRSPPSAIETMIESVQTFCTASRRPAGPLAPPTRRARLRSRWRSRCGGANAGRAGAEITSPGPPPMSNSHRDSPR
jgi:hypothetical protein